MVRELRDVTVQAHGFSAVVPAVEGWFCPNCDEIEFLGMGDGERYDAALRGLAEQESKYLGEVRRRLKLSQKEAADITGGGVNAFSRYERGVARPVAAVVNLFRLLDKHPELLKELPGA
jgi:HTH-type transcriptional regulator/antitoxin MqsA